eukprot:CAMPEP_0174369746 /NCGR_PEP_ID=MMETSP0811_2-20130205/93601_1 /TAXON_ID=73025 ORGANISM="Eutreptiella gymnastica-like, Strain CCMP1594" /NCGR_SAMPLE_ID=MMETSP0811_2 /ASSEMBLY_ACC=CAM_ASM_000667 /LENGTH=30 /DNA_ID= /DNA_START= /DNA_END= /DNA_ORIENTATION=
MSSSVALVRRHGVGWQVCFGASLEGWQIWD